MSPRANTPSSRRIQAAELVHVALAKPRTIVNHKLSARLFFNKKTHLHLVEAGIAVTRYSSQELLKVVMFADGGIKTNPRIDPSSKNMKDVVILQVMDGVLHIPTTHQSNPSKGLMHLSKKKDNKKSFYLVPRKDALESTIFGRNGVQMLSYVMLLTDLTGESLEYAVHHP